MVLTWIEVQQRAHTHTIKSPHGEENDSCIILITCLFHVTKQQSSGNLIHSSKSTRRNTPLNQLAYH